MERIGNEVKREWARFGSEATIGKLVERWPAAVGEAIARNAWPARVQRDGTLVVHAASSAWAFELAHLESTIRERLGKLAPKRIRFVPGPLPETSAPSSPGTTTRLPEVAPEDSAHAAEIAAACADENLRNLVARAVAASLARARSDLVI